ncbi:MAG: type I restriction enzyme M protein, partial [Arcticibacterium sp.]
KKLIEENLLKAVIGLPANLFFGTGIPASILIFDKNKGKNKDILFIDASGEFENGKNQNRLRSEDIDKIYNTFKNWEAIDKYSHIASFAELKENDFNLNIPRYVDTFEEEEPVDIAETQAEIKALKKQITQVEEKMEAFLTELGY